MSEGPKLVLTAVSKDWALVAATARAHGKHVVQQPRCSIDIPSMLDRHSVQVETEHIMESSHERRRRMERLAESERRPGDPQATTPSQARAGFAIMVLVLLVAVGLIAAMFVVNTRYDGSSPVPVNER